MPELAGRRIALIGGAGFIGHHLALYLKDLGAEPLVVDSLSVNNYYSLDPGSGDDPHAAMYVRIIQERLKTLDGAGIPLHVEDARDYHKLSALLKKLDVDSIIHLAAVSHAGKANKDPYSTFDHSLRTLENALDIARSTNLGIKHFVYLSSSMVYGDFSSDVVREDTPCEPLGIYGALKFAGEKMVIAYNQVFDLPYTIVRPSAVYGERCISRRVGQIFIENAMRGSSVVIHGDGSDRLDFTFVRDLAQGMECILLNDNARNQIFNLTYGSSRSIAELVDILTQHFGELHVECVPRDKLVPVRGTLSIEKAETLLGYRPQYPLKKGMELYLKWYEANWETWQSTRLYTDPLTDALTR